MSFDAGSIEASLTLDRSPFTQGLNEARKDARNFSNEKFRASIILEAQTGAAKKDIDELVERESHRDINIKVDVDEKPVQQALQDIERNTATTAARSGNTMGRLLLNPIVLQLGLLPGIAAVSGAATALALGAAVAGFGAIAIAAQKNNKDVTGAFKDTWNTVVKDTKAETAPLVPYIVGIAGQLAGAWRDIKPEFHAALAGLGPDLADLTDGVISLARNAMPGLGIAVTNSGAAIQGLGQMLGLVGTGVSQFFTEISYHSAEAGRGAATFGEILRGVLQFLGVEVGQFTAAWDQIGPKFAATFNQLLSVISQFTQGGLTGMTTTLNVALSVLQAVLAVVGPLAGGLGVLTGTVLGLKAGWMLLAGGMAGVVKLFELIRPATIGAALSRLTPLLTSAADRFGDMTTRVTGFGKAGDIAESGMTKVGTAIGKAAAALPILGAAIILGKEAMDSFFPSADKLASDIEKGGKAAGDASKKVNDHSLALNAGQLATNAFGATTEEVNAKIAEHRKTLSGLEKAQLDLTKAQNDLTYAQNTYGDNSAQANTAMHMVASATDAVTEAQKAAAAATQTHSDKIVEQTNLMLGAVGARLNYQAGLLSLETAQNSLNDAVKKHGANSLEARTADNSYQQSLLQVVQAVGQRAAAEAEANGVTDTAAAAASAMGQEVLRLAEAAGSNAPPALRQMVLGLDSSMLAALGAHREIDGAGNAIIVLPNGKRLTFPNDAKQAELSVHDLKGAIDAIPNNKVTTFTAHYVGFLNNPAAQAPAGFGLLPQTGTLGGKADGGLIHGQGGPRADANLYAVSDTEYIVNSTATRRNLGILDFINNGGDIGRMVVARSTGGLIGPGSGTQAPPTTTASDSALDVKALAKAVYDGVLGALDGARLSVDGQGIAKLVRDENRLFDQR